MFLTELTVLSSLTNATHQVVKILDKYISCSVNPLYFCVDHVNGYIKEKSVNKYLVFDSTDENQELLEKYNEVLNGIRDKIKKVSSDECDYEKDYMKVKFNSDDNLPLNKQLKFDNMTITIRSVFKEDGKLYQQVLLDDTL